MAGRKYIQLMELDEDHTNKTGKTLEPEKGSIVKPKG